MATEDGVPVRAAGSGGESSDEALAVERRPVVVGINASLAASRAVEWAAQEAVRRDVPLRIVHAGDGAGSTTSPTTDATTDWPAPIRRWFRAAEDLARARAPRVRPQAALVSGTVNEVLLAESRRAGVLVVGSRGLQRPIEALPTSTVTFAAMHANCPVVAVPAEATRPSATGPVVLGVDGSAVSAAAIEFAFDAAKRRGTTLVAVHAWSDVAQEPEGETAGISVGWELTQREQDNLLADQLMPWQDKYPDVEVQRVVAHEQPINALLRHAADAGLLVVGSRGRGDFAGMLLGSTSQALLYCAQCPIAVVRTPGATHPRSNHSGLDDFPS